MNNILIETVKFGVILMSKHNSLSPKEYFSENNLLKANTYLYSAVSDGVKKVYTNNDEITIYGNRGILAPNEVSFSNLYINGLLQPKVNYKIEKGQLTLLTEDVPAKGTTIVISYIIFVESSLKELNSALIEGHIPSGLISAGPSTGDNIEIIPTEDPLPLDLKIEHRMRSSLNSIFANTINIWNYSITVKNIGDQLIESIVITHNILLDKIIKVVDFPPSKGVVFSNHETITWSIDSLEVKESATVHFKITGFYINSGTRYLYKTLAFGKSLSGPVQSQVIPSDQVLVKKSLKITKTLTSGPLEVNTNNQYTWKAEIKITNLSKQYITNISLIDELIFDTIKNVKVLSATDGTYTVDKNNILWKIEQLAPLDSMVLVFEVIGNLIYSGYKNFGNLSGTGEIHGSKIKLETSRDFKIIVHHNKKKKNRLSLQESISGELVLLTNKYKTWYVDLIITNMYAVSLKDIIVTNYILLDDIENISTQFKSTGSICFSENIITWKIDNLPSGKSEKLTIEISGTFNATGLRSLNRAIAIAFIHNSENCIVTNIVSGQPIKVLDYITDRVCVLADKVYSRCQQKDYLKDISINLDKELFKNIIFKSGYIQENSLIISTIKNKPNFRRVTFTLKIPYEISLVNGTIVKGLLPNIYIDNILFMPEARDEFNFDIKLGTYSKFKNITTTNDNLIIDVGVVSIIKVTGTVSLLLPYFKYFPDPQPAEEFSSYLNQGTSNYNLCNYESNINKCNAIFGNLKIDKEILSGALITNSMAINSWTFQIKVINDGFGPISNIVVTDKILLENLSYVNILSISQGSATLKDKEIIWRVGSLNSVNSATMTVEIVGSFILNSKDLSVINYHYNTKSDGKKSKFTNEGELKKYGDNGIISPEEVTFYNLYINGVLQPKPNYKVEKGLLSLNTKDIPLMESMITLESLIIKDQNNNLLHSTTYQYNTLGEDKKIYLSDDEILSYGNRGILDPNEISYENLFINGLLQPNINYIIEKDKLTLNTVDTPTKGAPITILFVAIFTKS